MRLPHLLLSVLFLGLFGACTATTSESEPTPEATFITTETIPTTNVGEPTADVASTTEPTVTETTLPSNPAGEQPTPTSSSSTVQAEFNGVVFNYDPQFLSQVTGQFVLNQAGVYGWGHQGPPIYYWNVPDLVQFTFTVPQSSVREPMIVIQPVRDAEGLIFPAYMEEELGDEFISWETALNQGENPFASNRTGQAQMLEFVNGRGVRQILHITNGMWASEVTNQNLFYNYRGFTHDGRYFVWIQIPLAATGLFDEPIIPKPEFLELTRADGDEEYYQGVFDQLNELQPEQFTPSLTVLDNLVQSLFIPAEASLNSSILTAEENCADDSQFIADVTIPDGTVLEPRTIFTKTWEVKNTGNCIWNATYFLNSIEEADFYILEVPQPSVVLPGETTELTLVLQSPALPGNYYMAWQLSSISRSGIPEGPFGATFYVEINIEETASPLLPPAGVWEIYHVRLTPNSTLSQGEAETWIGEMMTLGEEEITFQGQSCTDVSYSGEVMKVEMYTQNTPPFTPALLQTSPEKTIDIIRTNCSLAGLEEMIYLTNLGRYKELVMIKDGVLFFLKPRK